jgi:hypothetical protein
MEAYFGGILLAEAAMRGLVFLLALCLAGVTAFPQALPQVTPLPSAVCSIPLIRFTAGDIDPSIAKKAPSANDGMPQLRVPAPPCGEPAAQESTLAQRLGDPWERLRAVQPSVFTQRLLEQKQRLKALQERYGAGAKPPAENEEATPTPAP